MKQIIFKLLPIFDFVLVIPVWFAAWLMKCIRRAGMHRLPVCRKALLRVGVFPIRDHYFEPQFDYRNKMRSWTDERNLPGINWNINEQLELLAKFQYPDELKKFPWEKPKELGFYFGNDSFMAGDAEYWYQMIREFKPSRVFEIGSGNSTLMAVAAIRRNRADDPGYHCKHVCIEPFEQPWLEDTGVTIRRELLENIEPSFFWDLEENDFLFIDSSHIIRPQGDVLVEYLELLPILNKGVIVHIHDIFSPRNYPAYWLEEKVLFWNEQYLVEAFLTQNHDWEIIGALNYLYHNHYSDLSKIAPYLNPDQEPGSLYIKKVSSPTEARNRHTQHANSQKQSSSSVE